MFMKIVQILIKSTGRLEKYWKPIGLLSLDLYEIFNKDEGQNWFIEIIHLGCLCEYDITQELLN
jgi:hypothetical protein